MSTSLNLFYSIEEMKKRVQNESLYHEDGSEEKNFNGRAIGDDDFAMLSNLMEETANEIFILLHRLAYGVSYGFEYGEENISYNLLVPDDFDTNLSSSLDIAVKKAITDLCLYKWYDKKNIMSEKVSFNMNDSIKKLRSLINFRVGKRKTYRWY